MKVSSLFHINQIYMYTINFISTAKAYYFLTNSALFWCIGIQWHSQYRARGAPLTVKNLPKIRKKREEIRKKRKNWEEKAEIGKVLSLCPSWQIRLIITSTVGIGIKFEMILSMFSFLMRWVGIESKLFWVIENGIEMKWFWGIENSTGIKPMY